MTSPVETRTVIFTVEDGVVINTCKPESIESGDDARLNVRAIAEMVPELPVPMLIDLAGIREVRREARVYYSSEECAKVIAAAGFLVSSPLTRVIGTFFVGLNRPKMPAKLFTDRADAMEWLKGFTP